MTSSHEYNACSASVILENLTFLHSHRCLGTPKSLQYWTSLQRPPRSTSQYFSMHHRYWNTKSTGACLASETKIQLSSTSDVWQNQGTLRSFHLSIHSREDQHMTQPFLSVPDDQGIKVSLGTGVQHNLELGVVRFLSGRIHLPQSEHKEKPEK